MNRKSLILAFILSAIPGMGLVYVEKNVFGILVFLISGLSFLICLTGILLIIGFPVYILVNVVAAIATIWGVIKYPGGWKWL